MAHETTGRTGPLDAQLLQHLEWLGTLSPGCLAVLAGAEHVIRYANPPFQALTGQRPLIGRSAREAFPELVDQGFFELLDRVLEAAEPVRVEALPLYLAPAPGAQPRHLELWLQPLRDAERTVAGVLLHALDVTDRARAHERVEARLERQVRQQAALVQLGQRALAGLPAADLVPRTLAELAETVGGEVAMLWQLLPDRRTLGLHYGHGVAAPRPEDERIQVDDDNAVSRVVREGRPVLVDNAEAVGALAPPLCASARSSVSVPVGGQGAMWGVLSVASAGARRFDSDAALFAQRVADLLGLALGRETGVAATGPAGAAAEPQPQRRAEDRSANDAGTVLLVEDEPVVRALTAQLLRRGGYRVLEAGHGDEALALAARGGAIDLLLTDLLMPRMNGRELAEQLHRTHPDVPVLYMSGYTADVIASEGTLGEGIHFLPKPFTAAELMSRAHDAIHRLPPRREVPTLP